MAVRTIAAGGGNWNATATWVEGAVPVAGDTVFAAVTSGQLTVNVASACTSIDFTNYTNTLTSNANLTVAGNVTLVAAMTIVGGSALTISATSTLTSNGKIWLGAINFSAGTFTLADNWIVNGTVTWNANGSLLLSNTLTCMGNFTLTQAPNPSSTATIVLGGTGTWSGTLAVRGVTLQINTTGKITISGTVNRGIRTLEYIAGTVITTGSTLNISAAATLINMDKIAWNTVTVTAGTTLTMNKFFSGSPKQKTTIQSSTSGTAYTITFQDTFEKTAKFVKASDCSLTRKGQLLVLTPNSDKGGNSGIRYINQSPNGIAKNAPSIVNTMTSPALGLAADPCFY